MKNYKTQAEVDADLVDGNLTVKDDVTFDFARVGIPGAISAGNISAWNISAWDISAGNINARDISYYAVCFAYNNITCKSISSRRENGRHFVLGGEIKIEKEK